MASGHAFTVWGLVLACFVCGDTPAFADARHDPNLHAVATRDGGAIAVGADGFAVQYDAAKGVWTRQRLPTRVAINAVTRVGRRTIWTAGVGGQTMVHDGRKWRSPPGSTGRTFYGIAMVAANRGVVVGDSGRMYARAGDRWDRIRVKVPGKPRLRAVAPLGRGGRAPLLAVGDRGTAVWLSGPVQFAKSRIETTGVSENLHSLAVCPGRRGEAVAGGGDGRVVVRGARGTWRRLPDAPGTVRGVVVECRRGRVRSVFAAGAGVWRLDRGQRTWRSLLSAPKLRLNDVARLDKRRLVVVGDGGVRRIIDVRKRDGAP